MNSNVLNLIVPRSLPDVDIQRAASADRKTADQNAADQIKFRDTLASIENKASVERAKNANQANKANEANKKAQQVRESKLQARQKVAEQKSAEQKARDVADAAVKKSQSESSAPSRTSSDAKPQAPASKEVEQSSNKEINDQQSSNKSKLGSSDKTSSTTDAKQASTTNSSTTDSSTDTNGDAEVADTVQETSDSADLNEQVGQTAPLLEIKIPNETLDKNTSTLTPTELGQAAIKLEQVKGTKTKALLTDAEAGKSTLEGLEELTNDTHAISLESKADTKTKTSVDETEQLTDLQLLANDSAQSANSNIENSNTLTNPLAALAQTLVAATSDSAGIETSELVASTASESLQIAAHQQGDLKGLKSGSQTQLLATASATNTENGSKNSELDASSFKSLLTEMKEEATVSQNQLDAVLSDPKSSADSNRPQASSLGNFGLPNFSSSEANARGFMVRTPIEVPVGQPQWSQAVGDRVLWLAAQNVTSAELHLHPEDLGPLQVKVSIGQDQTTQISFTSHHAQVREILDQSMQRLKDMFAEQGVHSVQVDISDRSQHRQAQEQRPKFNQGHSTEVDDEVSVAVSNIQIKRLVDHYA